MKQLETDPWSEIDTRFKVGDVVKGSVSKIASFGAFVELEDDIDGLVHISQISEERIEKVKDKLNASGTIDPLIDDSRLMAERWRNAQLILIPEGPHAFNHLPTAVARKTNAFVRNWLDERLATISMAAAAE